MKPPFAILIPILAALFLSGCATTQSASVVNADFEKARAENTLQSWDAFLKVHPYVQGDNCGRCNAAYDRYNQLLQREQDDWAAAQSQNTAAAYLEYVSARKPGSSPHYDEAMAKARELLSPDKATPDDYQAYLAMYPADPKAPAMRHGLMRARARKVRESGSADACAQFMAAYPGTEEAAKLKPTCERFEYQAAQTMRTRLALEFYLKRFPQSAEAAGAQKLLASLPRAAVSGETEQALDMLPRVREASADLRSNECLQALSAQVQASGDPMSAKAEDARAQFFDYMNGKDTPLCQGEMSVPDSARAIVGSAIRTLALVRQHQARLASAFDKNAKLSDQAREIGGSASKLAADSEAFELELQAFFGYMPADPDKPQEKASKSAKDAELRAHRAFELAQNGSFSSKKESAAEVLRLMDSEAQLLTRVIAYYEKPARRTP